MEKILWTGLVAALLYIVGPSPNPLLHKEGVKLMIACQSPPPCEGGGWGVVDTLQLDKETGLVIDERLNLVRAHCTACHSPKLITQTHLTRDGWRQKIRWMQRTQKLWDLGESEPVVLDYLVKYYGPEDRSFDGRRLPLPKQKW